MDKAVEKSPELKEGGSGSDVCKLGEDVHGER